MMTFRLLLQRMRNQGNIRIRFSLEKPKEPNIAEIFRATIGGKFAPLLALENQDTETEALINSFNTAVTETTNILGKHRPAKKPWVTDNILKLCDERRELKQKKNTTEGAKPCTKTECDYLYGWNFFKKRQKQINKKTVTHAKMSPKMRNFTDIAGNAKEEEDHMFSSASSSLSSSSSPPPYLSLSSLSFVFAPVQRN